VILDHLIGKRPENYLSKGLAESEVVFLGQVADARGPTYGASAGVWFLLSGEETKQG
jgi:hypothetical protein